MGRLTRDPEVRYSAGDNQMAIARYTLAVDRRFNRNNSEQTADFIPCVAFGKAGEFAEKYFRKGMKMIIDDQEFAESKNASSGSAGDFGGSSIPEAPHSQNLNDDFMNVPDGIDEELPFA